MAAIIGLFFLGNFLRKDGKFLNSHISGNANMGRKGISCATSQDKIARKDKRHILRDTLS